MATGTGNAIINFPASPQAAENKVIITITDTIPNNSAKLIQILATPPIDIASNNVDTIVILMTGGLTCTVSKDSGVSWVSVDVSVFTGGASTVVYGNGLFLLTGAASSQILKSSDGLSWSNATAFSASGNWSAICYGGDRWVAHSSGTTLSNYSTDNCVTWQIGTVNSAHVSHKNRYAYGNGYFSLFGLNQLGSRSTDGLTWVSNGPAIGSNNQRTLTFLNGFHYSMAGGFFSSINASSDGGATWQQVLGTYSGNRIINGDYFRAFDNYLIGGTNFSGSLSRLYISSDNGLTWTQRFIDSMGGLGNCGPFASIPGKLFGLVNTGMNGIVLFTGYNTRSITNSNQQITPYKAAPGTDKASVTITGLTSFVNTDNVEAWIMGNDSTSDHNQIEHQMAPIKLRVTNPITGVGFTINATSEYRLKGDFKVRYVWAS